MDEIDEALDIQEKYTDRLMKTMERYIPYGAKKDDMDSIDENTFKHGESFYEITSVIEKARRMIRDAYIQRNLDVEFIEINVKMRGKNR